MDVSDYKVGEIFFIFLKLGFYPRFCTQLQVEWLFSNSGEQIELISKETSTCVQVCNNSVVAFFSQKNITAILECSGACPLQLGKERQINVARF